jgi:hypothetical protein
MSPRRTYQRPPLDTVVKEARAKLSSWPPLRAGLFGSDYDRFIRVAEEFKSDVSKRYSW